MQQREERKCQKRAATCNTYRAANQLWHCQESPWMDWNLQRPRYEISDLSMLGSTSGNKMTFLCCVPLLHTMEILTPNMNLNLHSRRMLSATTLESVIKNGLLYCSSRGTHEILTSQDGGCLLQGLTAQGGVEPRTHTVHHWGMLVERGGRRFTMSNQHNQVYTNI